MRFDKDGNILVAGYFLDYNDDVGYGGISSLNPSLGINWHYTLTTSYGSDDSKYYIFKSSAIYQSGLT